jgi:glutamate synthase (NADPH/NADH) small chain
MAAWIGELAKGNMGNAIAIIHSRSNLPAVCGRVCAHERQCEGHCVFAKKGESIHIGKLERFVADFDSEAGLAHEDIPEKTRGRVAVIGSGPAGLTVAGDLSRKGFAVDIYEMEADAGGVLMYGIPEYRLPKEVVRRETRKIESLGVNIHLNTIIGPDFTVDRLFAEGYDAVFMGTGVGVPKTLPIPGIDHPGVRQAIRFLRRVSLCERGLIGRDEVHVSPGDRVFVVGCGNTAMDAARSAIRMEASEVTIVYHRTINEMSALKAEYDEAVEEGVKFLWQTSITAIDGGEGQSLRGVTLRTGDDVRYAPAEKVLLAVGSQPATRIVSSTAGIDVDERGYVLVRDFPYGMTTRRGVFAGGDVTNRPASVVHAMADAKKVADGIANYIDAVRLLQAIEK